ncbi:IPT/TIG domain-containing protein [Flavobacterium sp.]|uniref:IPT/TIG domain-containing protein n=1 Tax=Flavobacterium sp. TaxID=239 RepID=UPI00262D72A7|nr:IPT/TIG domain-containing protein [Flavobacterium sp.]
MKNFKFKKLFGLFFLAALLVSFSGCSSSDDEGSGNPPTIESVSAAADTELAPITIGYADNVYIIRGSGFTSLQKIYFNETDTYFNPAFVTDSAIFVTIDRNTPYANTTNELKVVTANGTAVFNFTVAPPAPQVDSYNSINAQAGDVITIYGSFFLNPTVTIGDTPATIQSSTETEIQALVPAGSNRKLVTVTTISGSDTASQPIGTAIYDDTYASFVENWLGPWDGSGFTVDTENKIQGASSIKATFTGYTGFKIPMYNSPASTAGYSGIRVSFKSTKESGKFKVVLNGNYGAGKEISFTNQWTSFVIPFSDLGGAPDTINEIVLQEFANGGGDVLYIDDVGFVLQ